MGDVTDKLRLHLRRHLCPLVGYTQLFVHLLLSGGITPTIEKQQHQSQHDGGGSNEHIHESGTLLFCLELIDLEERVQLVKMLTGIATEYGILLTIQLLIDLCCLRILPQHHQRLGPYLFCMIILLCGHQPHAISIEEGIGRIATS